MYENGKVVEKTWDQMKPYYTHDSGEPVDQMGASLGIVG
jgi:hypothetical protein